MLNYNLKTNIIKNETLLKIINYKNMQKLTFSQN